MSTQAYILPATSLVPNNPQPLLYYPGALRPWASRTPVELHRLFQSNGWKTQWIFRYGPTQRSHYHSLIHECMAILSGTATIRFGVADTSDDLEESTSGNAREEGGIEINVQAGDVLIIPAGVAHKTYHTSPAAPFALLTPGGGRGIGSDDFHSALNDIELTGFTMMGAYPLNCGTWDFSVGGEDNGNFRQSWMVPKPEHDPIYGRSAEGLCVRWTDSSLSERRDPRARL